MKKSFTCIVILLNIILSFPHAYGMDESLEEGPAAKRTAVTIGKALSCSNFCIELAECQRKAITNLELNKVLYYAEAFSLAFYGESLELTFSAWERGAVSVESYETFKYQGKGVSLKSIELPQGQREEFLSSHVRLCLVSSYLLEKSLPIWKLISWHHEEDPWKDTQKLQQIDNREIYRYFKEIPSHSIPLLKILVKNSKEIESTFQTKISVQTIITALNLLKRYINEQGPCSTENRAICIREELEGSTPSILPFERSPWATLSEEVFAEQFHTVRWPLQKDPKEDDSFIFGSLFSPDDVTFPREPFASLYLRKYTLELLAISAGYGNGEALYHFRKAFDFLTDDSENEIDEKKDSLKQEVHTFIDKYFQETESLLDSQIASNLSPSFERSRVFFLKGLIKLLHYQAPREASSFFKEAIDIPRAAYLYASTAQFNGSEEQRGFYQKAVDGGFKYAKLELCKRFLGDLQSQYSAFLECGKEGLPEGYYRAAYLLKDHSELGVDLSFERLLEKAGEGGMLQAFDSLAKKSLRNKDIKNAKKYYQQMLSRGDTKAFYDMAHLFIEENNSDQALSHLQKALWFGEKELQKLDPQQPPELFKQRQYQYLELLKQMALHETPDV